MFGTKRKPKPPREPRLARAARAFFEPWGQMNAALREECRRDLELAGAAMGRVFDATGNPDEYARRLIQLALLIGSAKLMGKSVADCYGEARLGIPSEWWPFLDPLFSFRASGAQLAQAAAQ